MFVNIEDNSQVKSTELSLICVILKLELWTNFKVDVSIGQPAGAAFIQEVDVFDEETEERNHNLRIKYDKKFMLTFYIRDVRFCFFLEASCVLSHLLLDAVCSLRPLGGAAESSAVVTEVTGRVHLVLNEVRQKRQSSNTNIGLHTWGYNV